MKGRKFLTRAAFGPGRKSRSGKKVRRRPGTNRHPGISTHDTRDGTQQWHG